MSDFMKQYHLVIDALLKTEPIQVGEWQSMKTGDSLAHRTHEILNMTLEYPMPEDVPGLQADVQPSLPWAENHFQERVSGIPHNPPPSHTSWPWGRHNGLHQDADARFSHTYPERFWPKFANEGQIRPNGRQVFVPHNGIRFEHGDLSDVVNLLVTKPLTRQAFLPVWFPEDTGAVSGQRVPCTIGYHFIIRSNQLHVVYYIRSCDILRHFRNDVYLAVRLAQWMVEQLTYRWESVDHWEAPGSPYTPGAYPLDVGILTMHITSLHAFAGDRSELTRDQTAS